MYMYFATKSSHEATIVPHSLTSGLLGICLGDGPFPCCRGSREPSRQRCAATPSGPVPRGQTDTCSYSGNACLAVPEPPAAVRRASCSAACQPLPSPCPTLGPVSSRRRPCSRSLDPLGHGHAHLTMTGFDGADTWRPCYGVEKFPKSLLTAVHLSAKSTVQISPSAGQLRPACLSSQPCMSLGFYPVIQAVACLVPNEAARRRPAEPMGK